MQLKNASELNYFVLKYRHQIDVTRTQKRVLIGKHRIWETSRLKADDLVLGRTN